MHDNPWITAIRILLAYALTVVIWGAAISYVQFSEAKLSREELLPPTPRPPGWTRYFSEDFDSKSAMPGHYCREKDPKSICAPRAVRERDYFGGR